ncbi:putative immunity protein [Sinorhizobium meliloti]|uniref:putative immunity protein n=1 Tax=Rhizobium meliloti TaxID=382 RepID=UPI003D65B103
MREKRLIAEHRGGPLSATEHRKLMKWACDCAERVLPLLRDGVDERLRVAIAASREWQNGHLKPGKAMRASVGAHAAARGYADPLSIAVARSVGQAAGTAHFAEHAIGAALYALKAVKLAGGSVDDERRWQDNQLPKELLHMVREVRAFKEKAFKLC